MLWLHNKKGTSEDVPFCLPYYRHIAIEDELAVCRVEVPAAEEAVVCRERARVCGGKYFVDFVRDEGFFFLCISAPEEKDYHLVAFVELSDDGIGKKLPAASAV